MLFPIGDTPNPTRTAWANLTLIAINIAAFVLISLPLSVQAIDLDSADAQDYVMTVSRLTGVHPLEVARQSSEYDVFLWQRGFRADRPDAQALLLSMFLHAGWLHLLGNMWFLWIFGDNVEDRLGSVRYVFAYLFTGIAATLVHATFVEQTALPMVGASGAISGVLGFYYVWFPRNQVKLLFWFYFFATVYLVPARLVLAFFLIVENLLPFLMSPSASSGVAYGAHIGGFVAGFLLATLWTPQEREGGLTWVEDAR